MSLKCNKTSYSDQPFKCNLSVYSERAYLVLRVLIDYDYSTAFNIILESSKNLELNSIE